MIEIWKSVKGYEGLYEVSNKGSVRSLDYHYTAKNQHCDFRRIRRGRVLKPHISTHGYRIVDLCNITPVHFSIHRLVAIAFIPNPLNLKMVNHKNGKKADNGVENLEWITAGGNIKHAHAIGLMPIRKGSDSNNASLNNKKVLEIREKYTNGGWSHKRLGHLYGVGATTIGHIIRRQTWNHI